MNWLNLRDYELYLFSFLFFLFFSFLCYEYQSTASPPKSESNHRFLETTICYVMIYFISLSNQELSHYNRAKLYRLFSLSG